MASAVHCSARFSERWVFPVGLLDQKCQSFHRDGNQGIPVGKSGEPNYLNREFVGSWREAQEALLWLKEPGNYRKNLDFVQGQHDRVFQSCLMYLNREAQAASCYRAVWLGGGVRMGGDIVGGLGGRTMCRRLCPFLDASLMHPISLQLCLPVCPIPSQANIEFGQGPSIRVCVCV